MRNSTIPESSLHKSIASESLNDTNREPRLPLNNSFLSILSLQRISANDRQSAEFESNSEVKFPPPMKMKTSTVDHHFCKNDAGRTQHDNRFSQLLRLYQSSAIHCS